MSSGTAIVASLLLLAANAFFVGAEFAIVSVRREAVEARARTGSRAARTTLAAMGDVSRMMAAAQLGITVASLGLGYLGEPAVAHLLEGPFAAIRLPEALVHPVAFAIALALVSFLHVVLGEMVPKNVALAGPDRAAVALTPVLIFWATVARPVIAVLNGIANLSLRTVGVTPRDEVQSTFTRDEMAGLVDQSHAGGLLDAEEERLVRSALDLEERDARAVLLPMAELVTVRADATPADVEGAANASGFSRFPVLDDAGRLGGYLHLKDLLANDDDHLHEPVDQRFVRSMPTVRDTDPLHRVLDSMQRRSAHLARVVDAEGTALGVVAFEDVIEELVGEIRAETRGGTAVVGRRGLVARV